jgi:tetratricopeptide (TPR) repeat protein
MLRILCGAPACALFLYACRAGSAPEAPPVSEAPAQKESSATELADEAIRLIEEGRLEAARGVLDRLLLADRLERARAHLAAEQPEDALTEIDAALAIAPADRALQLVKADASLRLAEAQIRVGGNGMLIQGALEDALAYYGRAGESAHALFGASRAAWWLARPKEALAFARRGMAQRGADEGLTSAFGVPPERIYAEQVYAAYASARAEARPEAGELLRESEEALAKVLGRTSDDPWAWGTLSDLWEWEGQLASSKDALERGLVRAPADAGLLARLARVTRALEGPEGAVRAFERFTAANPSVVAGRWELAVARFDQALARYEGEPRVLDPQPFEGIEAEFRALRAGAPEFAQGALGYEVVCRLARGWCAFHAGDLARARGAFLSMNELFERGVEWALPGRLESGIQGLFFVADAYSQDDALAAGETFETLHALQPDQYLWANNAGFFLRDAAVALEREARAFCAAARGEIVNAEALSELRQRAGLARADSGERGAFARLADERAARARAIMERSWRAYQPAAELAPSDVRVVNDAALVLTYYLHHDLELAESLFLRCVEMGGPQLEEKRKALALEADPARAEALEAELELLTEAWGDAHQNLGVLAWFHRGDAAAARPWLEKSVEIWPERPEVLNSFLPQVRGERAPDRDDFLAWAKPCETP